MPNLLRSQLAGMLAASFTNPPGFTLAPILDGVNAGTAVTFSQVLGVVGTPTPTVSYALKKNGTTVLSGNYATVNNAYMSTLTGDTLVVVATLTNIFGVAVATSTPLIVGQTQSFVPTILANPVIGKALAYATPGYAGSISSQQWYRNKGSGPVLIPGATSATYTPSLTSALGDSDVGGFFSVRVVTPTGNAKSQEFAASNAVLSQTGLQSTPSPITNHTYAGRVADTITVYTVATIRTAQNSGTSYIDTVVAPGTYVGGAGTVFGNVALFPGGTQFNTNLYNVISLSAAACVAPATAKPATATRPGTSTGVGFFTKNGTIYDANGNEFRPRGFNRLHWDANQPGNDTGLFHGKANSHRLFIDTSQSWLGINKPLLDAMITNSVVPAPVIPYVRANFTASFSGTTMTVTAMNSGVIGVAPQISPGSGGGFVSAGVSGATVVTAQLTNTNGSGIPGKEGTYTTSTSNSIGTPQNVVYSNGTSGLNNPEIAIAAAQVWVDNYANFGPYERWMILNVCNEWGASGSASDTSWRDTYITIVGMLRTAGYKGTIRIDAPGSGQDSATGGRAWTLLNHAAAVLAADPQKNCSFSLHCYGVYQAGWLAGVAQQLNTLSDASNIAFDIGEFGPANQDGESGSPTTAQQLETISIAEAYRLGHYDWAWDAPPALTDTTHTYFADVYRATSNGYSTSNPADLTPKGQQRVLDSVWGLATIATPATVFP